MNIRHYLFACLALISSLTACKHEQDTVPPTDTNSPIDSSPVTEVGQPQGNPTSQTIGPEGGSLSTPDGAVQLVIPAGAINKATTITIQPITNHAPNGLGLAYRFLPDGTQFAKPATLTFRYRASAVAANDPDMLDVVFQDTDRHWQGVAGASADTANHQISVPMPHFSDWSAFEKAKIKSVDIEGVSQLDLGESARLKLVDALLPPLIKAPAGDSLVMDLSTVKWSVAGGEVNGRITSNGTEAIYTAPSSYPPQNPVAVVAEITMKGNIKKVFLIKTILIGADYFTCTIGGKQFNWTKISCVQLGSIAGSHISGYNTNPAQSLNINLFSTLKVGSYPYIDPRTSQPNAGGCWAEFSDDYATGSGYISAIVPCSPDWLLSPGAVTITQIDEVNGETYVRGHLTGAYSKPPSDCPQDILTKSIQGDFRIKAKIRN